MYIPNDREEIKSICGKACPTWLYNLRRREPASDATSYCVKYNISSFYIGLIKRKLSLIMERKNKYVMT